MTYNVTWLVAEWLQSGCRVVAEWFSSPAGPRPASPVAKRWWLAPHSKNFRLAATSSHHGSSLLFTITQASGVIWVILLEPQNKIFSKLTTPHVFFSTPAQETAIPPMFNSFKIVSQKWRETQWSLRNAVYRFINVIYWRGGFQRGRGRFQIYF